MKAIKIYFSWIDGLLSKQVDATGLALFRIFYSITLIFEISQIIYFRHLVFDKIPFLVPSEINMLPGLLVWVISVVFILFGFYTRQAALVNYVLSLVFIGTITTYEYHVFYIYMCVNFLFLFVDVSKDHSIDRLRKKLKFSSSIKEFKPSKSASSINYYALIIFTLGFFYFDSVIFKFFSQTWVNGLGMWLPASLPMATHFDLSPVLNIKVLALGFGYLTLAFEAVFLFTFHVKKLRTLLLSIGLILHVGIIIIFPIPWFGLCMLSLYLLMVPSSWWEWMEKKIKLNRQNLTVFYDQTCLFCNRTRMIFNHFDYLKKIEWKGISSASVEELKDVSKNELLISMHAVSKSGQIVKGLDAYLQILRRIPLALPLYLVLRLPGIYHLGKAIYNKIANNRKEYHCTDETCGYTPPIPENLDRIAVMQNFTVQNIKVIVYGAIFILFIVLQINVSYQSYLKVTDKNGPFFSKIAWHISKTFFGMTTHGLFVDKHFDGYNHAIALEAITKDGKKIWLPIIKKDGSVGYLNYSFVWAKWTFRTNGPKIETRKLKESLRDFVTFWSFQNDYDINEVKFNVYVRPIRIPKQWEKNFLLNQKQTKWKNVGQAYWEEDTFVTSYPPIETIKFDE